MEKRFFCVKDVIAEAPQKATKFLLYENECTNGVIWYVPVGEKIPAHYHPDTDDVWVVLQGQGIYYLGAGKTKNIEKGMFIPAEKGDIHGVKATGEEPLVLAAVCAPMPAVMIKVEQ